MVEWRRGDPISSSDATERRLYRRPLDHDPDEPKAAAILRGEYEKHAELEARTGTDTKKGRFGKDNSFTTRTGPGSLRDMSA